MTCIEHFLGLIGTEVVMNALQDVKVPLRSKRKNLNVCCKFLKLGSKIDLISTSIFAPARVCCWCKVADSMFIG